MLPIRAPLLLRQQQLEEAGARCRRRSNRRRAAGRRVACAVGSPGGGGVALARIGLPLLESFQIPGVVPGALLCGLQLQLQPLGRAGTRRRRGGLALRAARAGAVRLRPIAAVS